jgi:hypothetical protein
MGGDDVCSSPPMFYNILSARACFLRKNTLMHSGYYFSSLEGSEALPLTFYVMRGIDDRLCLLVFAPCTTLANKGHGQYP